MKPMNIAKPPMARMMTPAGRPAIEARASLLGLPAGVVILAVGGFAMFMGFMFIRRIVDIEV